MTNSTTPRLSTTLPKLNYALAPTPVDRLHAMEKFLSPKKIQLYIKRDDLNGFAFGGSKVRPLEFIVPEAIRCGADTLLSAGVPQSNNCRQVAAFAARCGLNCELIIGGGKQETEPRGNLFLDNLFKAKIHRVKTLAERIPRLHARAEELKQEGKNPFVVPIGSALPLGSVSYALAFQELMDQLKKMTVDIDTIVIATSSGTSQAGLTLAAKALEFSGKVLGISIDEPPPPESDYLKRMTDLANGASALLKLPLSFKESDFNLSYDYLGAGYGVVGDAERNAIKLLASKESILLDPVYSGRAFAGMLDLIERGTIASDEKVLFWHTGGSVALFAYAEDIL